MSLEGKNGDLLVIEEQVPLIIFGHEAVSQPFNANGKVVISDELPWFLKESRLELEYQPYVIYNIELEKYFVYAPLLAGAPGWEWNDNASSSCMSEDGIVYIIGKTEMIRENWENKKNILAVPCRPYCKSMRSSPPNDAIFNFLYIDYNFDGAFYPLEVFDKELRGGGPR